MCLSRHYNRSVLSALVSLSVSQSLHIYVSYPACLLLTRWCECICVDMLMWMHLVHCKVIVFVLRHSSSTIRFFELWKHGSHHKVSSHVLQALAPAYSFFPIYLFYTFCAADTLLSLSACERQLKFAATEHRKQRDWVTELCGKKEIARTAKWSLCCPSLVVCSSSWWPAAYRRNEETGCWDGIVMDQWSKSHWWLTVLRGDKQLGPTPPATWVMATTLQDPCQSDLSSVQSGTIRSLSTDHKNI